MSSACCCLLRGPRPFLGDGSAASPPKADLFIPKPYVPDTISEKYELNNAHYYSECFICLLFISLFSHNCVQNSSRSKTYFLSTEITLNIKCHCLTISNTKLAFITIQLQQQTSYTRLLLIINFKQTLQLQNWTTSSHCLGSLQRSFQNLWTKIWKDLEFQNQFKKIIVCWKLETFSVAILVMNFFSLCCRFTE